ncbi:DsbE family thiol:disulfide interchange protein [Lentibacter algarum]|uniref:DsbE family thiol:disulfide interchange protein n=1 Tax=Lentibacter algarum TaxID=576131 RepID=UPI001C0952BE|nr:DsbE family thiol:disulfide interchange protein [Lentibacter algarum]MBU2982686.1 DsbE family thiol:disulfide interchange protein [Lentibacter algarum]
MAKISPLMLAPPLIFGALAAMLLIGLMRDDPDALPSALKGKPAPAVAVTKLGEKPLFDDATLRKDGVKLVNFWASWCAPCRVEHPNLEALAAEGIPIYGINHKDKPENALKFLRELGDPYTALGADVDGRISLNWGVYGVPETYVIDGNGIVILRHAGPITQRVIESTIRPAIEQARGN